MILTALNSNIGRVLTNSIQNCLKKAGSKKNVIFRNHSCEKSGHDINNLCGLHNDLYDNIEINVTAP